MADVIIVCSGGTAPPSGTTLDRVDITVSLNTAITSRLQDSTNGSEALLIINEPGSGLAGSGRATLAQLACAIPKVKYGPPN